MTIGAVVFDMDGTVVQLTLDFHQFRTSLGISADIPILEWIAQQPAPDVHLKKLEDWEQAGAAIAEPMPGVVEVMQQLRYWGLGIGLLTRNCRAATQIVLQRVGLQFDLVVTRDDAPAKPHPDAIAPFFEQFNLPPSRVVVVGDYRFDIQQGILVGSPTALMLNGKPDNPYMEKPDRVLHQIEDLLPFVQQVLEIGV